MDNNKITQNQKNKKYYRKKYRNILSKLTKEHHQSVSTFLSQFVYRKLPKEGLIASFVKIPSENEIDLDWINKQLSSEGRLALPKVGLNGLEFYQVDKMEFLTSRPPYNIPEPNSIYFRKIDLEELSVVLVPGLAFNRDCYRLGRGCGYYDKFLEKLYRLDKRIKTIGVGFREQLINNPNVMPIDEWDITVGELVLL